MLQVFFKDKLYSLIFFFLLIRKLQKIVKSQGTS